MDIMNDRRKKFVRFVLSSLSSSAIDLGLFTLFCGMFRGRFGSGYAAAATVAARVISSVYNYLINYKVVFASRSDHLRTSLRYVLVSGIKMMLSAAMVTGLLAVIPVKRELFLKIPVDTFLFFLNYYVQRKFVYR